MMELKTVLTVPYLNTIDIKIIILHDKMLYLNRLIFDTCTQRIRNVFNCEKK